jgi:hypothetical protein
MIMAKPMLTKQKGADKFLSAKELEAISTGISRRASIFDPATKTINGYKYEIHNDRYIRTLEDTE